MTELPPEKPPLFSSESPDASTLHYIFWGENGLRAGWGVLAFLILSLLFANIGGIATSHIHLSTAFGLALGETIRCIAALGATAIMASFEKRSWAAYGYTPKSIFPKFSSGVIVGFAALSLLLGTLAAMKDYGLGSLALHGAQLAGYTLFWALTFFIVGVFEEAFFRGYALATLTRGIGFWPAALVLSVVFGLMHRANAGESWFGLVSVALCGLMLCFAIWRTGSLWWAIGFHAMWDYSESFIYSTQDSGIPIDGHLLNSHFQGPAWLTGGAVGPEASYLILPVLAGIMAVIHFMYPAKKTESESSLQ